MRAVVLSERMVRIDAEQLTQKAAKRISFRERLFAFLALLVMALLATGSFRQESLAYDEVTHVPSGLAYWQQHDTRLNAEHPPLLKMIAAFPLLFTNVRADYSHPSWCGSGGPECQWEFGRKFFGEWNRGASQPAESMERILRLGRLPMLFVSLLLGWTIYRVTRALAGPGGAMLSLTLFVTCPLYLGYGPLVITDIGLCLFVLLSAWSLADLWERPNPRNALAFALSTAAALLSKFSALLILPSIGLFLIWTWLRNRRSAPVIAASVVPHWRHLFASGAVALSICYLFYGLTSSHTSASELANARLASITRYRPPERILLFTSHFLATHPGWEDALRPFWLYVVGVGYLNAGLNRPTYLLGHHHWHGVWYYFPVVSFFKLPPGMLGLVGLLFVCGILYWLKQEASGTAIAEENRTRVRALMSFFIVFTLAAMRSKLNIGIRHFSIPITIMVVLVALILPLMKSVVPARHRIAAYGLAGILTVSCLVTAFSTYPHYISYYNWFRLGAPKQEIVAESNLDWGQSLGEVRQFAAQHHISQLYVDSRMSPLDPSLFLPEAKAWKCDDPNPEAPEWAVVSADFLLKEAPSCGGLMQYEHWPIADETMYAFRITNDSYAKEDLAWKKQYPKYTVAPAALDVRPLASSPLK